MKAISVKQPWASMIAGGEKTIETRTWPTKYRGRLLIVSSLTPKIRDLPAGMALCTANLVDCRKMTTDDEAAACCPVYDGAWAWVLENITPVDPFPVKGTLGLYEVDYTDDLDYEVKEREAILIENNPGMHPVHARNKAAKEIRMQKGQN
ncbi:MAG: ASCH domain-containing protein [Gammaproteobacteria bacterium]|nr:ASCH domain-containing protein [Gammaproteobacteria bacterium]